MRPITAGRGGELPRRHCATAILSYIVECRLTGVSPDPELLRVASPWDLWWVCMRAGSAAGASVRVNPDGSDTCARCDDLVRELVSTDPPGDPGLADKQTCPCMLHWSQEMRAPAPPAWWPRMRMSVALVKPGTHVDSVATLLEESYEIRSASPLDLTRSDIRRLYPDAYGADFVEAQLAYYMSETSTVLVLTAKPESFPIPSEVKASIRERLGTSSLLRNHLHMPDNPGECVCDLAHLTRQPDIIRELYERYDSDTANERIAHYRAALEQRQSRPHPR